MIPNSQVIEGKKKRMEATVAKRKATIAAKKATSNTQQCGSEEDSEDSSTEVCSSG